MFRPIRVRSYLAVMQLHGFDVKQVLAGSGIGSERLEEPSYLISLDQYRSVIGNILHLTGNRGIAFELGSHSEVADLGIVGYAMISSETVRQALTLWGRYSRSLLGTCTGIRVAEETAQQVLVEIVEELPNPGGLAFCVEEFVTITQKIGGILTGENFSPQRMTVSYAAPAHASIYEGICQCPVKFAAARTEIVFPRRLVDKVLRTSDREFNDICLEHCGQIMRQIAQDSPLLSRLRLLLLRRPSAIPTQEEAAETLGLSARTLRRQLHEQGRSYHKLVEAFRTELACEYLRSSKLTAKEIGYLLGFISSNAFRRAFKSWTGQTVREYRDSRGIAEIATPGDDN